MNDLRKIIGSILVILMLAIVAGCSNDSNNSVPGKSGSLTGSGK